MPRGTIEYILSPFAQRMFYNSFQDSTLKAWRKVRQNWFYSGPALISGYALYTWANNAHEEELKKHRF